MKRGIDYQIRHINYTEFEKDEFFITPTEKREELFYKFPKYSYQHEARVCLMNNPMNNLYDRFSLKIGALSESCPIIPGIKTYFETTANIVKL